jgi:thiosulfate dehydrogenase [quinone] large subunit
VFAGVAIALIEIAIGVGTLLGVASLTAAIGGFVVSLTLLLSATWHVHPYFLGSDSIYAVAWLALFAGLAQMDHARTGHLVGPLDVIDHVDRRQFLRGAVVGGLTLVIATASKALSGPSADTLATAPQPRTNPSGPTGPSTPSTGGTGGAPSVSGRTITTLDQLPIGEAIGFTAPAVGAAVLVRLAADEVVAYSRTCTHAGCLVGYDSSNRILVCPCHGAEFDPAHGAEAIAGPTSTALPAVDVVVDPNTRAIILPS